MADLMQQARDGFEAWATSQQLPIKRHRWGEYKVDDTEAAWEAWQAALRAAPEGFVMVPVEPTREMMDAGRAAVIAEHCASPKWTPRQHYKASGLPTTGIPHDVLDEHGPLTKESVAVMVYGTMLAARPQGVKDV